MILKYFVKLQRGVGLLQAPIGFPDSQFDPPDPAFLPGVPTPAVRPDGLQPLPRLRPELAITAESPAPGDQTRAGKTALLV